MSVARWRLGGTPGRKSVIWVTAAFLIALIPEDRSVSKAEMAESLPTVKQLSLSTRAAGTMAGIERQAHAQEIREASAQLATSETAAFAIRTRPRVRNSCAPSRRRPAELPTSTRMRPRKASHFRADRGPQIHSDMARNAELPEE